MKNLIKNVLLLSTAGLWYGCYYDHPPVIEPPANVSYASDIQPVFDQSCVACHNGNLIPDLRSGNSYDALINNGLVVPLDKSASELYKRVTGAGSLMPPGSPLPQSKVDLIGQWIEDGAKNN